MNLLAKTKAIKKKLRKRLHLNYVVYNDIKLPSNDIRYMSPAFNEDQYYINSSFHESDRFVNRLGVTRDSEIMELGPSTGRTVIGLMNKFGPVKRYVGVDINTDNLEWCRHFIGKKFKCCEFIHVDMHHVKYNKEGKVKLDDTFRLPFNDNSFDVVYANSVFANNTDEQIGVFAKEFYRILRKGGRVFLSAFIEENVPPMTINPDGYIMKCLHPMHIVRFEKNYFLSLFTKSGFSLDAYEQSTEIDYQSAIYLIK